MKSPMIILVKELIQKNIMNKKIYKEPLLRINKKIPIIN